MDEELQRTVEAILFAAARKLELAELAKLCKRAESEVLAVLTEWKSKLDAATSPTMLLQDGTAWKLTVREKYVSVVKKVVTTTELPKGHLETLAVVAYKAPVLQSKVIKIRTNKAYDHLAQLENSGFITREKSGRTKLIKLTPKFFEYFDIDPSKLKHKFGSATELEKAIESKEKEIEQTEVEQRKKTEERLGKPQIKLETYPSLQPVEEMLPTGVEVFQEKMDSLEVYDVPLESIPPEERPPIKVPRPRKPRVPKPEEAPAEEVPEEIPVPGVPTHEAVAPAVEEVPVEAAKLGAPVAVEEKPVVKEKKPRAPKKVLKVEEVAKPAEEIAPIEAPKVEEKPEEIPLTPEQKISKEAEEKAKELKPKAFEEGKGLFPKGIPPEVEAKIEERIKRILGGEPEEKEE